MNILELLDEVAAETKQEDLQEAWPILLGLKFTNVVGCITHAMPVTPGDHHHHVLDQDLDLYFGVLVISHNLPLMYLL